MGRPEGGARRADKPDGATELNNVRAGMLPAAMRSGSAGDVSAIVGEQVGTGRESLAK